MPTIATSVFVRLVKVPSIGSNARWVTYVLFSTVLMQFIPGCTFRPYYKEITHEMVVSFKSTSESVTKVFYTNEARDSLCDKPVRIFEVRNGDTLNIPGSGETKYWRPIYYKPFVGFRICLEQDGKKYLGAQSFRKGFRLYKAKVDCSINGNTRDSKTWPKRPDPADSTWPCNPEIQEKDILFPDEF
jgi:hypothetical protein